MTDMTGRENRALQVPPVLSYKALENFPKALYGTTGGTCSARFFRPLGGKTLDESSRQYHQPTRLNY